MRQRMFWEWSDAERAFYFFSEKLMPDVRTHEQMTPVLYNPKAAAPAEFYYMYRGLCLPKDTELFANHNVRYDITVIPPATIGGEFVKTKGHFHPLKGEHSYPEIYEVLSGEAHYLFQNNGQVIVFHAMAGDKVIVPPDYGHVTINPGKATLVMANLVSPGFSSDYEQYVKMHGAAFYELDKGWVENPHYTAVSLRKDVPGRDNCKFFDSKETLYDLFLEAPDRFVFLNEPELYF